MLDGNARLNLATFVSTWMEPQARELMAACLDKNMIDKDEYPQTAELEMRCVNILSRPLARARRGRRHRLLDHRLQRGRDAGRPGAQAALAAAPQGRGQAGRQAQPGDGHQRPDLLGEVRQLLGRRDAAGADGGQPLHALGRGGGQALRREHDRRGRDPGLDLRRLLRADRGDLQGAGRPAGAHRPERAGARRRRVGRVRRAVRRPRPGMGLPAAAGGLDQRLRPQVRPRLPGRGLDRVARREGAARGPDLLGQLPGRQHAHVRAQLLTSRCPGGGPVLQLPAARLRGLPGRPAVQPRRGHPAVGRRSPSWGRSS